MSKNGIYYAVKVAQEYGNVAGGNIELEIQYAFVFSEEFCE